MSNCVRFNKFETELRESAQKTLANPGATPAEKRFARTVLNTSFEEARSRLLLNKAKRALGPKPQAPGRELDAWRDGLTRLKCELILDTPGSSLAQTRMAERTLKEIAARERQRPQREPNRPKSEPRAPRPAKDEPLDPAVAAFFAGLSAETEKVTEVQPEGEPAPLVPTSIAGPAAVERYCGVHQVSFAVCHCDDKGVCPLCLVPKGVCHCPKKR
jgi:hypothetical protein